MHAPPPTPRWEIVPLAAGQRAEPVAREWIAKQLDCAPDGVRLGRSPHGRPMLEEPAGWDCNWSHSGGHLAVALGALMRVGIDIERQRGRPRALELARRFFATGEADWLAAREEPGRDFLRLWCAKEAVLKAHGRGLAFGLDRLEIQDGSGGLRLAACDPRLGEPEHWQLLEIQPAPGCLGAVAWFLTDAPPGPADPAGVAAPGHTSRP